MIKYRESRVFGVGEIGLYTEPLHQYRRSLEGAEEDEGVTQQLSSLCISM